METTLPGKTLWETQQYQRDHGRHAAMAIALQLAAKHVRADEDGPVPPPFIVYAPVPDGDDEDRIAAVDAWAARHHVTARWYQDGHHYGAPLSFGPLTWLVYMVPAAVLDVPAPREGAPALTGAAA